MIARGTGWFALVALACACKSAQQAPVDPRLGSAEANVGLYTPGSTLGIVTTAAQSTSDAAMPKVAGGMVTGDRCVGSTGNAGTAGMLMVTFTTQPLGHEKHWGPANVGAVWIEDESGAYIKTIERWAAVRTKSLYHWLEHTCATSWPEPDAVSTATAPDTSAAHTSTWDAKDLNGKVVPDGTYHVLIEVTETETDYGPTVMYPFQKGTVASSVDMPETQVVQVAPLPAAPFVPLLNVAISYMPSAGGSDMSSGGTSKGKDAGPAADSGMLGDGGAGTINNATGAGSTSGNEPSGLDASMLLPSP